MPALRSASRLTEGALVRRGCVSAFWHDACRKEKMNKRRCLPQGRPVAFTLEPSFHRPVEAAVADVGTPSSPIAD
jgi:hypothetical protein